MTESHIRNVIEAALLAAGKPLQAAELVDLFDEGAARPTLAVVLATLAALAEEYSTRGIEIKETAAGFRVQVRTGFSNEISRLWPERPAKYSRALLETLAIIAYRQPITRAEIEAVRGVAVNPNIVKTVIERNWVHVVGHRDVPGRPELLGTTRDFLDYFGLKRLDELPPLAELKTIGDIKVQFDLPDPGPLALPFDGVTGAANARVRNSDAANTESGDGAVAVAGDADATPRDAEATAAVPREDGAQAAHDGTAVEASTDATSAEVPVVAKPATDAQGTAESASTDGSRAGYAAGHDVSPTSVGATDTHDAVAAVDASEGKSAEPDAGAEHTVAEASEGTAEEPSHEVSGATESSKKSSRSAGGGSGGKKKRGKARSSDTALHEAEEFAASVDADLAAGDDDSSDDDELSAAGPDSSELVAGPRDIDD